VNHNDNAIHIVDYRIEYYYKTILCTFTERVHNKMHVKLFVSTGPYATDSYVWVISLQAVGMGCVCIKNKD